MAVESHKFTSDAISSAACDPDSGQLSVTIKPTGRTYGYAACSPATWEAFKTAESAGRFYNLTIRKTCLSLGEIPPLDDILADAWVLDSDIPTSNPSEFDDVIASIEASYVSQNKSENKSEFEDLPEPEPPFGVVESASLPLPQTSPAIYLPDERIQVLLALAADYKVDALTITILDNETLKDAEETFKTGKELYKALAEEIQPVTQAHYSSWKRVKDQENQILQPIDEATDRLSRAIGQYRREQDRLASIEAQQALEQARNEAKRLQDEQTESLKRQLASENPEMAAEIMSDTSIQAAPVPVFIPRQEILPPKTAGTTYKPKWTGIVDEFENLILSVAEGIMERRGGETGAGEAPVSCLAPVQSVLNDLAKTHKDRLGTYSWGIHAEDQGGAAKTREKRSS